MDRKKKTKAGFKPVRLEQTAVTTHEGIFLDKTKTAGSQETVYSNLVQNNLEVVENGDADRRMNEHDGPIMFLHIREYTKHQKRTLLDSGTQLVQIRS